MRTTSEQRIEEFTRHGWWGERTLTSLFDDAVSSNPDHPALVDQFNRSEFSDGDAVRLSFKEVSNVVDVLAASMYEHGIRQDDIAVVQLPNIAELPIIYLALARLGAIVSPVPVQYGKFELSKAQELLEPKAFITTSNFKGQNFARDNSAAFPKEVLTFCFGKEPPDNAIALSAAMTLDDDSSYRNYVEQIEIDANDIFTICWTSGTTGQPKGVPRSHNHWLASATAANDVGTMRDGEAVLNPFPLVNMAAIAGFLYPWLMRKSTLVLHHPLDLPVFLQTNTGRKNRLYAGAARRTDNVAQEAGTSGLDRPFQPPLDWLRQRTAFRMDGSWISGPVWHRYSECIWIQRGCMSLLRYRGPA